MLHQVGVSFDLYYDARKHKIKIHFRYLYDIKVDQYLSDRECSEPYGQCERDAQWRRGNTAPPGNRILVPLSSGRSLTFILTELPDAHSSSVICQTALTHLYS